MNNKNKSKKNKKKDSSEDKKVKTADLKRYIEEALDDMYDPEIPVSIWQLGLIYEINIDKTNNVHIVMTLTSPSCPVAGTLPRDVHRRIRAIEGVGRCRVEVTFDPPWNPEKMSEAAKFELGML
mgnify:CR=1 FL=1